jgi:hypothetical protein
MLAKKSGRLGKVAVSTDDITYNDIAEVTEISYSLAHETEDATSFTSGGVKNSDYGETQVSLSVQYLYDPADVGQDRVRTSAEGKTKIWYRYRPAGDSSGEDSIKFQGKIESLEYGNARNEKATQSLSVVSDGAITVGTVP